MITVMAPGKVSLDFGPIQMTIRALAGSSPLTGQAQQAAHYARAVLYELAAYQKPAASPQLAIKSGDDWPEVLKRMLAAVQRADDITLTPMAAVAGTIADLTADWLLARGATKAIVNNGGDIAVRLATGQKTAVGIAPAIGRQPTHKLVLDDSRGIGGVATSGLGGRSFTKGIATAAVVAAGTAAVADACATSLGNATYVGHPAVKLARAEQLDPNTDIWGHQVVTEVGLLPPAVVEAALMNGWSRASELYNQGVIAGAAVFVQQQLVMIPEGFIIAL
ncbi:FAD:protein FMN transferase [Sporomusa termitida]|uniref:FAD:protein FMN transferase n=1 Tax=Sporomusa termitida TaxID=2377 RepID=A0A517DYP9_9FIRM|nr:FAD:protein FMN transferase [Sporomusa termitida]QDR82490.1 hypothetical protein SPTER_39180 [Sporomusa termitida]